MLRHKCIWKVIFLYLYACEFYKSFFHLWYFINKIQWLPYYCFVIHMPLRKHIIIKIIIIKAVIQLLCNNIKEITLNVVICYMRVSFALMLCLYVVFIYFCWKLNTFYINSVQMMGRMQSCALFRYHHENVYELVFTIIILKIFRIY